jgi:hypothetical protein
MYMGTRGKYGEIPEGSGYPNPKLMNENILPLLRSNPNPDSALSTLEVVEWQPITDFP